jgi:spore germination cell wall hydrolase CwlJ-like protein
MATAALMLTLLSADAETLAAVAWSEDPSAAVAVMYTVINRAQIRDTSVYREAIAADAYHGFSRGRDPWTRASRCPSCRAEMLSLRITARRVLDGATPDPTRGATHFHRVGSETPVWAPTPRRWRRIGQHYFYNVMGWR